MTPRSAQFSLGNIPPVRSFSIKVESDGPELTAEIRSILEEGIRACLVEAEAPGKSYVLRVVEGPIRRQLKNTHGKVLYLNTSVIHVHLPARLLLYHCELRCPNPELALGTSKVLREVFKISLTEILTAFHRNNEAANKGADKGATLLKGELESLDLIRATGIINSRPKLFDGMGWVGYWDALDALLTFIQETCPSATLEDAILLVRLLDSKFCYVQAIVGRPEKATCDIVRSVKHNDAAPFVFWSDLPVLTAVRSLWACPVPESEFLGTVASLAFTTPDKAEETLKLFDRYGIVKWSGHGFAIQGPVTRFIVVHGQLPNDASWVDINPALPPCHPAPDQSGQDPIGLTQLLERSIREQFSSLALVDRLRQEAERIKDNDYAEACADLDQARSEDDPDKIHAASIRLTEVTSLWKERLQQASHLAEKLSTYRGMDPQTVFTAIAGLRRLLRTPDSLPEEARKE